MTRVILKENEIGLIFFENGNFTTCRGVLDTSDYSNVRNAFIAKGDSFLYTIPDFLGYATISPTWKEVKIK